MPMPMPMPCRSGPSWGGRALVLTAFTRSFRLGKAWDGKPRPKPTGDGCDEWEAKARDRRGGDV